MKLGGCMPASRGQCNHSGLPRGQQLTHLQAKVLASSRPSANTLKMCWKEGAMEHQSLYLAPFTSKRAGLAFLSKHRGLLTLLCFSVNRQQSEIIDVAFTFPSLLFISQQIQQRQINAAPFCQGGHVLAPAALLPSHELRAGLSGPLYIG